MIVRIYFWHLVIFLFSLSIIFLLCSYIFSSLITASVLLLLCKHGQDYCRKQNDQTESKHVSLGLNYDLNSVLSEADRGGIGKKSVRRKRRKPIEYNNPGPFYVEEVETDTFTMWGNRSLSSPKTRNTDRLNTSLHSPSRPIGRTNLSATMPVQMSSAGSSPVVLRQRRHNMSTDKKSMLSAAGPLLSSPFMPQIKRALGLEPKTQLNYSPRRQNTSLNNSTVISPASPGALPHVRLTKSSKPALSDRNSSMLTRSNTVKVAPPVPGRVASPSLQQLRIDSTPVEDGGTPDTYAVISALKERRKRSINAYEEVQEHPVPQAKRRRQESQQSNASTSSMPSLPDHLPDLTNTDFTRRLETPAGGVKRPSRPSQEDAEEWERVAPSVKRPRAEVGVARNNSILSSLSSSQRFRNAQMSKRKASNSFSEKENGQSPASKSQRNAPPKLSHLSVALTSDITLDTSRGESFMGECRIPDQQMTNGHAEAQKADEATSKPEQTANESSGTPVKRLPSMKKTPSIYSGLGNVGSFRKAQYANVVATIDDYDSDREAEQNRVQQLLQDIDESFNQEQAKKTDMLTTSASTSVTTTSAVSSLASVATVTTSTSSASSVLSALEKLSKSPAVTGAAGKEQQSSTSALVTGQKSSQGSPIAAPSDTLASLSKLASPPAGPPPSYQDTLTAKNQTATLPGVAATATSTAGITLGQVTSMPASSLSLATSTTPATAAAGFSFGAATSSTAASTVASTLTAATTLSAAPALGGHSFGSYSVSAPLPSGFTLTSPASSAPVTVTSSAVAPGGFSFGSTATVASTKANQPATTSAAPAAGGFSFGSQVAPVVATVTPTATTQASGFSFGSSAPAVASTVASTQPPGTLFGIPSTAPLVATSAAPAPIATSAATPAFGGFGGTSSAPTGGFSFGSTAAPAATSASATVNPAPAAGFSFGGVSAQGAAPAPAFGGFGSSTVTPATSAATATAGSAPLFGFGSSQPPAPSSGSTLFAAAPLSTAASSTPMFGGATTTTAASAPGFNFGAAPTSTAAPSATPGFSFGAQSAPTATATPFAAPAAPASTAQAGFSFGTTPAPTTTQAGFSFGTTPSTSAAQPGFAFGGTPQVTSAKATAAPAPFSFGATATTTAAATGFGTNTQTASTAAGFNFGQTAAQNTAAPGGFSFGASTAAAPAFGTASQTPAFGSGSTNQPPAFGAGSTNQPPPFGAGSTNQPPAFGAASTQAQTFGGSGTSTASAFGGSIGTSPTFGKSHSMPSFTTTDSSGSFNFGGGQAAPNVNPFGSGQVTPAKQTGSAFGMQNTDTTPKQQTGAMFAFGQQSNNASSSSQNPQGFNFAAAAANTNQNTAAGFNFNMSANTPTMPVFNFGATGSTPSFGATAPGPGTPNTGGFAMGTGEAPRPPRVVTKARRRGQRR